MIPANLLTPEALFLGSFVLLMIVIMIITIILFSRRLKIMTTSLLQLNQEYQETKTALTGGQQTTLQEIQHLHVAQATAQAAAATAQQETHELNILMPTWQKEITQLNRALRTTHQQGIWGEQELRRIVELAGMIHHCDFDIKLKLPNGKVPDMLIHMNDNRTIAIDAKAPSQAYLEAMNSEDEEKRKAKLEKYVGNIRGMITDLSKREYWAQLQPSPDQVILFLPNEAMFHTLLKHDLTLLDFAVEKNVLLASPVTLIALLKVIAYGWSQKQRAKNVQEIIDQSRALQKELANWLDQWQQLRGAIYQTSTKFNDITLTYETRIFPLIQEIEALDETHTMKKKDFELRPVPPHLVQPKQKENALTEAKEKEEKEPWSEKIVSSFTKFREMLPSSPLNNGKGNDTHKE